jgi:hypothetical protein
LENLKAILSQAKNLGQSPFSNAASDASLRVNSYARLRSPAMHNIISGASIQYLPPIIPAANSESRRVLEEAGWTSKRHSLLTEIIAEEPPERNNTFKKKKRSPSIKNFSEQ